jgi:hypothetical protein
MSWRSGQNEITTKNVRKGKWLLQNPEHGLGCSSTLRYKMYGKAPVLVVWCSRNTMKSGDGHELRRHEKVAW